MKKINKLQVTESEIRDGKIVETTSTPTQKGNFSDENFKIKRHKFDSLTLYEITETELEIIEKGSPSSIYLNFAIFLISIASSFLISLLTANYDNKQNVFIVFLLITIIGFVIGLLLIALWLKTKNDFNQTIKKIKDRVS
jgi:hypothetical protein